MKRLASLAVVAIALGGCSSSAAPTHSHSSSVSPTSTDASAAPGGGTFLTAALPADVLQISLVDSDGKAFSLADLAGKYVVISNFLTSCQEICPMTSANMRVISAAVAKAGLSDKVTVLEITVDAGRDNPARLDAYQRLYGAKTWTMASGTEKSLAALWTYFGAPAERMDLTAEEQAALPVDWQTGKPATYDMMHPDLVLILGPDSTWRWLDLGAPKSVDGKLPAPLESFLSADGRKNLKTPEEPAWTVEAVYAALTELTGSQIG